MIDFDLLQTELAEAEYERKKQKTYRRILTF